MSEEMDLNKEVEDLARIFSTPENAKKLWHQLVQLAFDMGRLDGYRVALEEVERLRKCI